MLEVFRLADLNCEDVQDQTVPLEHMSPNTPNYLLSKFVCEVAKQKREHYPPNSLYFLICAINPHLIIIDFEEILWGMSLLKLSIAIRGVGNL